MPLNRDVSTFAFWGGVVFSNDDDYCLIPFLFQRLCFVISLFFRVSLSFWSERVATTSTLAMTKDGQTMSLLVPRREMTCLWTTTTTKRKQLPPQQASNSRKAAPTQQGVMWSVLAVLFAWEIRSMPAAAAAESPSIASPRVGDISLCMRYPSILPSFSPPCCPSWRSFELFSYYVMENLR